MDKILSRLDKVEQTGRDKWQARCPAHDDREPSLSVRKDGDRVLLYCHAGCRTEAVVAAMGLTMGDLFLNNGGGQHRNAHGLTLDAYATAKKLPEPFLRDLGISETNEHGRPVVLMPYRDAEGAVACVRKRIAMRGDRFRWRKGDTKDKWPLYGLWRLADMREHGWVLLVEGESDAQTAWLHEIPALGVPGASNWQSRWANDLDGLDVYVWQEPDQGGDTLVGALQGDLPQAKVIEPPEGVKDLSAAYCAGQDVSALVGGLRTAAVPIRSVAVEPEANVPILWTEMGNGRRFAEQHKGKALHVEQWATWLLWDGQRWARDHSGAVMRKAKETVGLLYQEAQDIEAEAAALIGPLQAAQESGDTERAKEIRERRQKLQKEAKGALAWALKSQSKYRLKATIDLAASERPVVATPDDFDQKPWLLNVENGTLDLRTGELQPHDRADMLTKLAPVEYDPDASDPILDKYLADTTAGDRDFLSYLQRACGYTLTGVTDEEALFLVLGPAATGKSTLVEAMLAMLGDYGVKSSFDTFLLQRNKGGPKPEIVRLRGARMAAAVEPERGRGLAESMVKELTGGDTVAARDLYASPFEFEPEFKLWLAANESPRLSDDDSGIWRRLQRLPFEHEIPQEQQDPEVKRHLCSPEGRKALLAWAVEGCLMWQLGGLSTCDVVRRKTSALRAEMNPIGEFLEMRCVVDPDAETPARDLRDAYEEWAADFGAKAINNREWGERLKALGCHSHRERRGDSRIAVWQGIGLLDDALEEQDA